MRQNKEEVDFLRTHCQKKLDFERGRAKENETAFEQRLLALRAGKDSQIQEFRKIIEQLETDKQRFQERVYHLEDGQLVPTRLMNDQQAQTSEVPGDLNSEHRRQTSIRNQFRLLVRSPNHHLTLRKDLRCYLLLKSVVKQ
ncbi:hypothetical protein ACEPAF_6985 [Sanghuangporus sanghuang]